MVATASGSIMTLRIFKSRSTYIGKTIVRFSLTHNVVPLSMSLAQ